MPNQLYVQTQKVKIKTARPITGEKTEILEHIKNETEPKQGMNTCIGLWEKHVKTRHEYLYLPLQL